eukprot:7182925-Pyramimonas_sp.AAC.1
MGRLRVLLGRCGSLLEPSWVALGRSGGPPGPSWGVGRRKRRERQNASKINGESVIFPLGALSGVLLE